MPRFAANLTTMFNEWEFLDRFAAAAGAGFSAVEYLFPYDHSPEAIAKRLEANDLTQTLFNLPPGNWLANERGIAALPGREAEFRDSVRLALRYAEATGVKRLHVMAGLISPADPAARATFTDNLRYCADATAEHGVETLIEPINPRDIPGYFLADFDVAAALIAEIGHPNLKLQFDVYHRQIIHGDVTRGLEAMLPIVSHVQIASVPERHEPTTGELDDTHVFATLDRLGYDGFVGLEYRPRAGTLDGLAWMTALPNRPERQE